MVTIAGSSTPYLNPSSGYIARDALDALAASCLSWPLGSALASAPQLCLPRGTQGVIQSNPTPSCPTASVCHCRILPALPCLVSDNSLLLVGFLRPQSRGHNPAATKHLIYDCFSKRRHCDLPGPSSASGNQALAHTAALYTPLASPPQLVLAARSPTLKVALVCSSSRLFSTEDAAGPSPLPVTVGAGRLPHRRSLRG